MNDPLENLRALHISQWAWWPPAIGWCIVAALIVIAVYLSKRFLNQKKDRKRTLDHALVVAQYNVDVYRNTKDSKAYLESSNQLLRQITIHQYGRSKISSLAGQEWINFLNSAIQSPTLKPNSKLKETKVFCDEAAQALTSSAYQKDPCINVNKVDRAIRSWIKLQAKNNKQSAKIKISQGQQHV